MPLPDILNRVGRTFRLDHMKAAYRQCFRSPAAANYVLPDLAIFTGAMEHAPANGDPFIQGRAAGRRDCWLHLMEHLHLTEDEQFALMAGKPLAWKGPL